MQQAADVLVRNNVSVHGPDGAPVLVFIHGFGCDKVIWQRVLEDFAADYRVVLFDHVGAGGSDLSAYSAEKYGALDGYVDDLLEICDALDLRGATLVGHSVGGTMAIAAAARPAARERISRIVLLAASPSYVDHPQDGYVGGFTRGDIDELMLSIDGNFPVWAASMAPVVMGARFPDLAVELERRFCRVDPVIARQFFRVSFLTDVRHLLQEVTCPALVLQCANDALAPAAVGTYLHRHLPHAELVRMRAVGHMPHVSAPEETAEEILRWLAKP